MFKELFNLFAGFLTGLHLVSRFVLLFVLVLLFVPIAFSFLLFVLTALLAFILAATVLGIVKGVFSILKVLIVRNPNLKKKEQAPQVEPLGGKVKDESQEQNQVQLHA